MGIEDDYLEQNITLPIKRKTVNGLVALTGCVAAIDFIITPFISQIFTGEARTLHEYAGLPPETNKLGISLGFAYWGLTVLYLSPITKKLLGRPERE